MTAIALTIAGSDSGGGAGIQADVKTFSALGVYGASVITAVTAQNTSAVTAVHEVPSDVVSAQIAAVLDDLSVDAVKLGMLFSPAIIAETAEHLRFFNGPVVLDPVMIAKSGDSLLQDVAVDAMIAEMLPLASILTPNLPEAAKLLGCEPARTTAEMILQGKALLQMGPKAVLMKGGHGAGETLTDLLISPHYQVELTAPRLDTQNTHGTGCTLSSAIAAGLATGLDTEHAVRMAHSYLQKAIRAADTLEIGSGHGPVHHFIGLWA